MSYEGFEQFICPNGHIWEEDAVAFMYASVEERERILTCNHCQQKAVYICSVDETNGYYEEDKRTFRGPLKEIGFDDIAHIDHHGNKYFTKLMKYEIDNSTNRWEKI